MFRFPLTGDRVRNYDGLGGQLLFAYLHKHDVVRWTDNTLHIDWDRAPQVTNQLCGEIEKLYRDGIDRPKLVHWFAAYELVSAYLAPHPGSVWAKGPDALDLTLPRASWWTRCSRTNSRSACSSRRLPRSCAA